MQFTHVQTVVCHPGCWGFQCWIIGSSFRPYQLVDIHFDGCLQCCRDWILQRWFGSLTWLGLWFGTSPVSLRLPAWGVTTRAQCPISNVREPSGVFTSEMWVICVALLQIRACRPGRYLIVTDSMSSLGACRLGGLLQRLTRWCMKSRRSVGDWRIMGMKFTWCGFRRM
jgi:hypothetical protein